MNLGKNRTAEKSNDPIGQAIAFARQALSVHSQAGQRIAQSQVARDKAIEADSIAAVEALESNTAIPAGSAASLAIEIETLQRASQTTLARACEAIRLIYVAAAAGQREAAEQKRAQRTAILEKLRKPLAEIGLLIGVDVPLYTLRCVPQGVWERRFGMDAPDFELLGPGDCSPGVSMANPQPYVIPAFDRLAREIEAHESRAAELGERQVDAGGALDEVLESTIREVTPASRSAEVAA